MNKISLNGSKVLRSLGSNLSTLKPSNFKTFFMLMMGVFMLTGCVEEFEAELPNRDMVLVVNGTIKSGEENSFKLSWSTPLYSDKVVTLYDQMLNPYIVTTVDYVHGATVKVCGSDGSEYYCQEEVSQENGKEKVEYLCTLPELNKDVEYYLDIRLFNDEYKSIPQKPIRTPDIEEVTYVQADSLSDIDIVVSTAAPEDPSQITYFTWDFDDTWEVRPRRYTDVYFDTLQMKPIIKYVYPIYGWKFGKNKDLIIGSTANYTDGRFSKYKVFGIPRTDERIFWNYCCNLTQRAISKEEYEYNQAVYQAGWEMGGLFTPQPSALPTNIYSTKSNKTVIGFVGCSMNTVTVRGYVDGQKISRVLKKPNKLILDYNPSRQQMYNKIKNQHQLIAVYIESLGEVCEVWWADDVDLDIRLEGAIIEKPSYMPPIGSDYDDYYYKK